MNITFYSYKGGVGRTQLCANLAAYLCFYKKKKILLWDWDFEAPGLHWYFGLNSTDIKKPGTLELLENYVQTMRSGKTVFSKDLKFISSENIISLISGNDNEGKIDLITAGIYTDDYVQRFNDFNWYEFSVLLDGINYLAKLKEIIKTLGYDYILIDSRTGSTDYSGICNILLPDINVITMAPNAQNFEGCFKISHQILSHEFVKKGYRKPFILPILSRLDIDDNDNAVTWSKRFTTMFSFLLNKLDKNIDSESTEYAFSEIYLKETFLLYIRSISTGENLFFNKEIEDIESISFKRNYVNIADYIEKLKENDTLDISIKLNRNIFDISRKEKRTLSYWLEMGNRFIETNEYAKAIKQFQNAVSQGFNSYEIWLSLSKAFFKLGKYSESKSTIKKAIELNQSNYEAWAHAGNVNFARKDIKEAIECYEKAIEINPDYDEAKYNISVAYFYTEKYKDKGIDLINNMQKNMMRDKEEDRLILKELTEIGIKTKR